MTMAEIERMYRHRRSRRDMVMIQVALNVFMILGAWLGWAIATSLAAPWWACGVCMAVGAFAGIYPALWIHEWRLRSMR